MDRIYSTAIFTVYHHQSMDHRLFVQHKLVNDVYALIVLKEDNNNNNNNNDRKGRSRSARTL